ncbi:MAG: hypothetical protein KAS63_06915 [Candidatus Heimdallarchaeota archaeon]|nr:hypothetical protein [Candidatus Heimdallarchaeota archaeon]MCK4955076.1 hypothetical protein [Candidatus Heimdallarchaeota archaeon]
MPDITDTEKSQIREIAKEYATALWRIPFNDGLVLYVKTNNELHIHPARWKYCLKCGEINKKERMNKHRCLIDVEDFPILIQTSWYKLKEFFLTDLYKEFMKEVGIDKIPSIVPITETIEESKETKETKIPASEKEGI